MRDITILAMSDDASWLGHLWTELKPRGGLRLVTASSLEDACALIDCARARLIVVDWRAENISYDKMDALLWANSTIRNPATVVVISESYQPDQALSLYQMGVDEYLGMSHHAHQMAEILSGFLRGPCGHPNAPFRRAAETSSTVPAELPLSAYWVAAAAPA
jgi:DNA-binding NtrC family response regulator